MANAHLKSIDTEAILSTDDQIWDRTVAPLADCLIAYMGALGPEASALSAVAGLQDDIRRIAAILFPEDFDRMREFKAYLSSARKVRPDRACIPRALRKAVFERDDFRCVRCGSRWDICADHKIPESRGGATTLENLQTLCRRCNSRKSNRMEVPTGG